MNDKEFIEANKHKAIAELALVLSKKTVFDSAFILSQINGIQKAKNKLPEFYNNPNIVYSSKLSMEQCSSEHTAIFKSKLINGNSLVDLTGGFGIDSFYFAKQFKQVTYIEQNKELFIVVQQNIESLKADNINLINSSAEDYLKDSKEKIDVIYLDPGRRNESQRIFKLEECTPNIIELAPAIFKIAKKILLKTAPLLDIKQSLKNLKNVTKVWVVSVDNDCKEVLYLMENGVNIKPEINTINLTKVNQFFRFNHEQEGEANSSYSQPLEFLYEPNASILKAGAFNSISEKYTVNKLAPNTHLYTSEKLIENFPGRSFIVEQVLPFSPKYFKKTGITKANVGCRNFKDKPEQVKKKLNLKDGGEVYLFATTDLNHKPILISTIKI